MTGAVINAIIEDKKDLIRISTIDVAGNFTSIFTDVAAISNIDSQKFLRIQKDAGLFITAKKEMQGTLSKKVIQKQYVHINPNDCYISVDRIIEMRLYSHTQEEYKELPELIKEYITSTKTPKAEEVEASSGKILLTE